MPFQLLAMKSAFNENGAAFKDYNEYLSQCLQFFANFHCRFHQRFTKFCIFRELSVTTTEYFLANIGVTKVVCLHLGWAVCRWQREALTSPFSSLTPTAFFSMNNQDLKAQLLPQGRVSLDSSLSLTVFLRFILKHKETLQNKNAPRGITVRKHFPSEDKFLYSKTVQCLHSTYADVYYDSLKRGNSSFSQVYLILEISLSWTPDLANPVWETPL